MSDVYSPPPAMRCALIQNNVVVNVIMAMPDDIPPRNCIFICGIPDYVAVGTRYDANTGFAVEGDSK
jgi:hypothetical protein